MKIFNKEMDKKYIIKKFLSNIFQVVVFLFIVWGISRWQSKGLLSKDVIAPNFSLHAIDGRVYNLSDYKDKTVVIYFFSPWCSVCKYSSHNIVDIYESRNSKKVEVLAIALSWKNLSEVNTFAMEHSLKMPILLGNSKIVKNYNIESFPTIYVLKKDSIVYDRVIGYTTELGIKLRMP